MALKILNHSIYEQLEKQYPEYFSGLTRAADFDFEIRNIINERILSQKGICTSIIQVLDKLWQAYDWQRSAYAESPEVSTHGIDAMKEFLEKTIKQLGSPVHGHV